MCTYTGYTGVPSGGILVWLVVSVAVSEEGTEGGSPAPVGALGSRNGGNLQWRRRGHTLHTTSLQTVVELSSRLILTKSNSVSSPERGAKRLLQ